MKNLLPVIILLLLGFNSNAQTLGETKEGTISYVTSQSVYVKFESTENIAVGDTLFMVKEQKKTPILIVKELSSISCVCTPISSKQLLVNDIVTSSGKINKPAIPSEIEVAPIPVSVVEKTISDSVKKDLPTQPKQNVSGRISVSSYSNFSNVSDFSQRMRYNLSLNVQNIGDSKLSAETYISFAHKINEWNDVQADIFNALKIYSLSINYAFNKNNSVWLGRKINPRLSNVGAIDGLQYETKFKSFTTGIFAGTRPDYMNYGFNANLLQYGGYFGHDYTNKNGGNTQTSVAFVEQTNNGNTDRRFAYLQHSNTLVKNISFFGSVEFDLFNKVREISGMDTAYVKSSSPNLSNLYVSLRYRVIKQLTLSISYSARQNIVYYETYKSIIDQLLEQASMQGYMFQVNVRPIKNMTIGANVGYRYSKPDPRPTKNLYSYLTYSNLPWINASATLSATFMETSYLSGNIYSLGLSRDLIPGKVYGGIGYRYVNYKFVSAETPLVQNMAELNLTWRILKKLSLSANYEGTFEKSTNYDRIYVNLTQRF
ncbi:MAG: hypothetical protein ACOYN4_14555 [Bacteroidales bacterium]